MNEMRSGKAPGLDGFPVECVKKGGMALLEWLVRLFNLSFDMWVVPMDWRGVWPPPRHLLGSHTVLGISVPGGVNFALFVAYSFSSKSSYS